MIKHTGKWMIAQKTRTAAFYASNHPAGERKIATQVIQDISPYYTSPSSAVFIVKQTAGGVK
jgi:hypothetical protein